MPLFVYTLILLLSVSRVAGFRPYVQYASGLGLVRRSSSKLSSSSPPESSSEQKKEDVKPADRAATGMPARPPIIPMGDFAREDIVAPPPKEPVRLFQPQQSQVKRQQPPQVPTIINPTGWIEDPSRPTGYGRPDLDDNEEEMRQKMIDDNWTPEDVTELSPFQRWFRDTYIGSPYDSRKKQQARYVIKNITAICFAIGFFFTAVWFAFPGQFISVRGERDFSARYPTSFVEPEGLLSEEWQRSNAPTYSDASPGSSDGGFFDDAKGLPEKGFADQRVPLEQGKPFRLAPPPSLDL